MASDIEVVSLLKTIPWFLELKAEQLDQLATICACREFSPGEEIFQEGDREDCLYILLKGEVSISHRVPTRGQVQLLTAEPLDIIGWSSLTPVVRQRTATTRAVSAVRLLAFEGEALRRLCEVDHDLGYIILRRLVNVVASRLLVTRLNLLDMLIHSSEEHIQM